MNGEPRSNPWPRWRIAGRYIVETPLHLGDGEQRYHSLARFGDRDATEEDKKPASVARDRDGALYLPSSSVRGAVRAVLRRRFADDCRRLRRVYELFGFGPEPEEAEFAAEALRLTLPENDKPNAKRVAIKDGLGGSVSFLDAFVITAPDDRNAFVEDAVLKIEDGETPNPEAIEEYREEFRGKGTLVETSVSIAPATRTALSRHLANREIVPPGVAFEVALTGTGLDEEDIALLLAGLELAGAEGFGGGRKMGAGRLRWLCADDAPICRIDKNNVVEWLAQFKKVNVEPPVLNEEIRRHQLDNAGIQAKRKELLAEAAQSSGWVEVDLIFDGPFLVRDPVRDKFRKSGDAGVPALPRLGPDGEPMLPGRSVKGALRARARRIEQTVRGDTPADERSLADWLFGRADWGALVDCRDFHQAGTGDQPPDPLQHFVAIDRFTGGQAAGRLYSFRPAWQPTLRGRIRLDRRRIEDFLADEEREEEDKNRLRAALWLLLLTLCDLKEGELSFGLGAAKGYGTCTAKFEPGIEKLIEQFADPAEFDALVKNRNGPPALGLLFQQVPVTDPRQSASTGGAAAQAPHATRPLNLTEFINPYNFVPVIKTKEKDKAKRWFPNNETGAEQARTAGHERMPFQTSQASGLGRLRHDIWLAQDTNGEALYSGRILCRLTTENPTFIGAGQTPSKQGEQPQTEEKDQETEDNAKQKGSSTPQPFEIDGKPAIPASSLRGLLSSIAEAASQSSLRILQNDCLTYRLSNRERECKFFGFLKAPVETDQIPRLLEYTPRASGDIRDATLQFSERDIHPQVYRKFKMILSQLLSPMTANDARKHIEEGWDKAKAALTRRHFAFADRPQGSVVLAIECKDRKNCEIYEGDMLRFRLEGKQVTRLALGSLWRDWVAKENLLEPATVHDLFAAIADPSGQDKDLLPFDHLRRSFISPAELLFGFVSEGPEGERDRTVKFGRPAYSGRVRPSFGWLENHPKGGFYAPARTLKILSSPKPPSPAFYFKKRGDRYGCLDTRHGHPAAIAKGDLVLRSHVPNGRKFYHEHGKLPDEEHGRLGATWHEHERPDQKVKIKPIKADTSFLFHIDFDNLNRWELGLLCFALRPAPDYRHRIGIGKSLGLGRVLIEPLALFEIDRLHRYTRADALTAPRYAADRMHVFVNPDRIPQAPYPRRSYEQNEAYREKCAAMAAGQPAGFDDLVKPFADDADGNTLDALRRFGEDPPQRGGYRIPVRQPQLAGYEQLDEETETFRWYVENDRGWHRAMPLLVKDDSSGGRVRELDELVLPRHRRF